MNFGLQGKVALITGGSRGIGRATAFQLAAEGCSIAITGRGETWLHQTADELKCAGADVFVIQADCRKLEDVQRTIQAVIDKWKTIHILINNVGGSGAAPAATIEETPDDFWVDIYNRNALAAVRHTMLVIPYMRKQKWGRVVTVISKQGREGGGKPWYTMAKAAEMAMSKTMAMNWEMARDGLTFNCVAPGAVITEEGNWADFQREDPEKFEARIKSTFPLGRLGNPEEIASVITFICSEQASLLSGAAIPVDGAESKAF